MGNAEHSAAAGCEVETIEVGHRGTCSTVLCGCIADEVVVVAVVSTRVSVPAGRFV